MTFYDGIIDPDMLKREVEKVRKFIEDVQGIIGLTKDREPQRAP
jgi:hypothetical protein